MLNWILSCLSMRCLKAFQTMRFVAHNLFQIHLFVNYLFGFSIIVQKNRRIQLASCTGLKRIDSCQVFQIIICCLVTYKPPHLPNFKDRQHEIFKIFSQFDTCLEHFCTIQWTFRVGLHDPLFLSNYSSGIVSAHRNLDLHFFEFG